LATSPHAVIDRDPQFSWNRRLPGRLKNRRKSCPAFPPPLRALENWPVPPCRPASPILAAEPPARGHAQCGPATYPASIALHALVPAPGGWMLPAAPRELRSFARLSPWPESREEPTQESCWPE